MKKSFLFVSFLALTIFVSCETEDTTNVIAENNVTANEKKLEISEGLLTKLANNRINTNDVDVVDFMYPDGTTEKVYQVEGDIHMTEEYVSKLSSLKMSGRNYHTHNLVNQNTVIDIIGYTGGRNALSQKERTALQWAVDNYNRLNLNISFRLTFGTNYADKDMVVYHNPNNADGGGSAGFPSNGRPHKWVQIHGLNNYNTNIIEHVITHEIGHSIGMRHTDWYSRQSCGQNTNEGTAGVGAEPVPGTPQGYDSTSLMLACFSANEDGEFNNNDITALRYLY